MKKIILLFAAFLFYGNQPSYCEPALEPFSYFQDFSDSEEDAWVSYPLWQDTAYDPNFRVGNIVPGDPNISIDQLVQPYSNNDCYAGTQKLLDMYLVPDSEISLRYYIKSHLNAEFFKVRFAAGDFGKLDYTVSYPGTNRWENPKIGFSDIIAQNPQLSGVKAIKINAVALLVKIPSADPEMPFRFGADDIKITGERDTRFRFEIPRMTELSEWRNRFPDKHYHTGDMFEIRGGWMPGADKISLTVVSFTDIAKTFIREISLKKDNNGIWTLKPFRLSIPPGMYKGELKAFKGKAFKGEDRFTFIVEPENIKGNHPRLLFDSAGLEKIREKVKTEKYRPLLNEIISKAATYRKENPLETIIYDYDQFNDIDLIADLGAWSNRFHPWGYGIEFNALAYALTGDTEAAQYAVGLMLKQCDFPTFSHPWMEKRGRHMYWQGQQADNFAIGYDLLYGIMTEEQRKKVRDGFMRNFIQGSFKTYVEDNAITNSTSNWIAHQAGSPLMSLLAVYGDGEEFGNYEPYMTGLIYKVYEHISKAVTSDGSYGEGFGYYGFSMTVWCQLLPALERVMGIDMSKKLDRSYQEPVWSGFVKDKRTFYFGDSSQNLGPLNDFAWLLNKYNDPILGWLYGYLKGGETVQSLINEPDSIVTKDPSGENPVRLFRGTGTTVFKSGWDKDDFVFVMRTGPFYNHQHFDQGTFWLADRGETFIEERHGGAYEGDPFYRPLYTKPGAHSTILVDHNNQSQRAGDPLNFAGGFDDHAFVEHFLDTEKVSFSEGDIGRLYMDKVKSLKRNVLFIKPRTVILIDEAIPAEKNSDISLLFQTTYLKDIEPGGKISYIVKNGRKLGIIHLCPENSEIKAVQTPHYLSTLQNQKPLIKEGMLTVTARTDNAPLVFGNILTTDISGIGDIVNGKGFVSGKSGNIGFAFSTAPAANYTVSGITTDALAFTWSDGELFTARCTHIFKDGRKIMESTEPVTCRIASGSVKYYLSNNSKVRIRTDSKPHKIYLNGSVVKAYKYDKTTGELEIVLPQGDGELIVK